MADTLRIDWFRVLVQIQRADGGLRTVATVTGISEPQLRNYMSWDHEPAYWRGEAILRHWSSVTGKPQDSAPRQRRPFAAIGS